TRSRRMQKLPSLSPMFPRRLPSTTTGESKRLAAQEPGGLRDSRGLCLRAGTGHSPRDARQRLDGVAGPLILKVMLSQNTEIELHTPPKLATSHHSSARSSHMGVRASPQPVESRRQA